MLPKLLAAVAIATVGTLPVFLLGAQFVVIAPDLGLDERELGLAVGVFFASAAVASAPAGSLADRLGPRRSTAVAGGIATLGALGFALAVSSLASLLAAMVVAGIANAALQMSANAALAKSVPPSRQGLAFGVKQSAVPVAILLGGLALPAVALVVGWRATYAVLAACAALVVLTAVGRRRGAALPGGSKPEGEQAPRDALVLTAVATTLANGAANSLGAFLPAWAFTLGMSAANSGLLLALAAAVCAVGRVVAGVLGDRRGGRNMPVVAAQMAIGAVGFFLMTQHHLPLLIVGALLAFGLGWSWPGLLIFAVVRIGRDRPATASSAVQAGGFAGGAFGPPLFGWLVTVASYEIGWITAGAALLLAALLLLHARRMFLQDLARRPLT